MERGPKLNDPNKFREFGWFVLASLAESPKHANEVHRHVRELDAGYIAPETQATATLKRFIQQGLVTRGAGEAVVKRNLRRRVIVYTLTPQGEDALIEGEERLGMDPRILDKLLEYE